MFTSNAVYDVLSRFEIIGCIPRRLCREYKRVFLLAPDAGTDSSADAINVCSLEYALKNAPLHPEHHYACLCGGSDGKKPPAESENIFCVRGPADIFSLFSMLQERFLLLLTWERRLIDSIFNNCVFQTIVDESEFILNNPIYVLDASYRLLASSKHYKVDHPHMNFLAEHGYHSAEFVSILQNSGYLQSLNTTDDMIITPPESVIEYTAITKCSRQFGMFSVESGILCSHTPFSPYMVDLMSVFFKYIALCDKTHSMSDKLFLDGASLVLKEILEGKLREKDDIEERLSSMGFPCRGSFMLCLVEWEKHADGYPNRLAHDLSRALKSRVIFPYKNRVFILEHAYDPVPPDFCGKRCAELEAALEPYACFAGVSGSFHSACDLKKAYDQALRALELGEHRRKLGVDGQEKLFSFPRLFLPDIFAAYQENENNWFDNILCVKAVRSLMDHDSRYRKNLCGILYTYLLNERNATKTGEALNMSRNNVLHHVSKAAELIDYDLEDPEKRLELLVAFNLLDKRSS